MISDLRFASAKAAEIGFRLKLPALDASAYDHLVFWVKGDKRQGFATSFKVEFKRPVIIYNYPKDIKVTESCRWQHWHSYWNPMLSFTRARAP